MQKKNPEVNPEKLKAIVDAACYEFAKKGYDLASTNEITKAAGISKGLLFYYFESKQKLYNYLISLALKKLWDFHNKVDKNETDVFRYYEKMAQLQLELFKKSKSLLVFMGTIPKKEMSLLSKPLQDEVYKLLFSIQTLKDITNHPEKINLTLFRSDLDGFEILLIIDYAIKGYEAKLTKCMHSIDITETNFEEVMEDFRKFLQSLRKVFYKKERI